MSQSQVDADAALARSLAEQEASQQRIYEAERRRQEWDGYAQMRIYPYYYGAWNRPGYRPVVVYRDSDPCTSIWFVSCLFFWIAILFITVILVVYYS